VAGFLEEIDYIIAALLFFAGTRIMNESDFDGWTPLF
jgi:hypothetical protein